MKFVRGFTLFLVLFLFFPQIATADSSVEDNGSAVDNSVFQPERTCIHQFRFRDFDVTEKKELVPASLAVCNVCGIEISVQLDAASADITYDPNAGEHEHIYTQGAAPLRVVIEPEGWNRSTLCIHREHTYYQYTCVICGDAFEAYHFLNDMELCTHSDIPIFDFHIQDEFLHISVYQCDVCHGYKYAAMPCWTRNDKAFDMCEMTWLLHSK